MYSRRRSANSTRVKGALAIAVEGRTGSTPNCKKNEVPPRYWFVWAAQVEFGTGRIRNADLTNLDSRCMIPGCRGPESHKCQSKRHHLVNGVVSIKSRTFSAPDRLFGLQPIGHVLDQVLHSLRHEPWLTFFICDSPPTNLLSNYVITRFQF